MRILLLFCLLVFNFSFLYAQKMKKEIPTDVSGLFTAGEVGFDKGDVMVLDKKTGKLVLCREEYNPDIVGIVSTNSQLVLGIDEEEMRQEEADVSAQFTTNRKLSALQIQVDQSSSPQAIKELDNETRKLRHKFRKEKLSKIEIALLGVVPCKVTTENGFIKIGDLLTTSSKAGYAMKFILLDPKDAKDFDDLKRILSENERRRSAILGKSLESLESGDGKIEVLLNSR